jgi:hypothetical protein
MEHKIAFCLIGTKNYLNLAFNLIDSLEKHAQGKIGRCSYYLFTDDNHHASIRASLYNNVYIAHTDHLPWPLITLLRYTIFSSILNHLKAYDYIYYMDVDLEVIKDLDEQFLGDRVSTLHPGYFNTINKGQLPYCRDNKSKAYMHSSWGDAYYYGALQGGNKDEFTKMILTLKGNIEDDLKLNYIADWHDESHMNKYFWDNKPTKILHPGYAYVEGYNLPFEKIINAYIKNHDNFRKE